MEVVNIFNKELKSILESKLPVSRHKMSLITKSAMKALKFYKHVVQSVEKFISKCSCDYKVPGLYVIDAIVRQSKHQYCEKDVFVPRFMRNIVTTFVHLAQCDPKDVTAIERVLRLWQQNGVFPTDLVEALLELVYDANDKEKIIKAGEIVVKLVNEWNILKGKPQEKIDLFIPHVELINHNNNEMRNEGGLIDHITKLLTRFQAETGQDVTVEISQIEILHQKIVEQSALLAQGEMINSDTLSQLHQSMEELTKKAAKAAAVQQSKLAMLANDDKDHMNEATTDLEFVEQLQQMVDTLGQTRALQEELKQALESKQNISSKNDLLVGDKDFREMEEMNCFENANDEVVESVDIDLRMMHTSTPKHSFENDESEHGSVNNASYDKMSRSSSITSRKRRRSNSFTRIIKRKRSISKEKRRKEKRVRDVRKRHLPSLRDQSVGILSHTLFIGHLHKHVSEFKLRTLFEEYGSISEFNMIPPRGCAFVTFDKRKSAYKAISKMNELKFEGRELKVAWAPNKGVKDEKEFRDYWVIEEGCTYIPTEQFPINRSSELIDGFAELDEESLTEELKQAIYQFEQQKSEAVARGLEPSSVDTMISVAAEVVNKKIPLLSPNADSVVETGTRPFFNQFGTLPPMMLPPPAIPYPPPPPPPPHIFMATRPIPPPPMSSPTTTSSPNYIGHYNQCNIQPEMEDANMPVTSNVGNAHPMVSGFPHGPPILDPRMNDAYGGVLHHPPHGFIRLPPFRRPLMRSSLIRGGRFLRPPPLRFPRLPPPGFPAYRPPRF